MAATETSEREFLSVWRNFASDVARIRKRGSTKLSCFWLRTMLRWESRCDSQNPDPVIADPWMDNMIRMQISIDQELYSRAKAMARRRGISLAELCRRGLRETDSREPVERPWMKYAGILDGEPDGSETVDGVGYRREMPRNPE